MNNGRQEKSGKVENIHAGHRKNMRGRYLENGIGVFSEHQILEMLLFYAIARRDVNPLAHRLINRFGSLKAVLSAGVDELMKEGLSLNTAVLLRLTGDIGVEDEKKAAVETTVRNTNEAMLLCHSLLSREDNEAVALVCLDKNNRVIRTFTRSEGMSSSVGGLSKWILETALAAKATSVMIAHNHPSGSPEPSYEDTKTTELLEKLLRSVEISLLDHIIVTRNECYSLTRMHLCGDIALLKNSMAAAENEENEESGEAAVQDA